MISNSFGYSKFIKLKSLMILLNSVIYVIVNWSSNNNHQNLISNQTSYKNVIDMLTQELEKIKLMVNEYIQ